MTIRRKHWRKLSKGKRRAAPKSTEKLVYDRLREVWNWSKEKRRAARRVFVGRDTDGVELRRCEHCQQVFRRTQTQCDHIEPVIEVGTTLPKIEEGACEPGWDKIVARMWATAEGLQYLCKDCHKIKTGSENSKRWKGKTKK